MNLPVNITTIRKQQPTAILDAPLTQSSLANLASRWALSEAVKKNLLTLVDNSLEKAPSTISSPPKKATELARISHTILREGVQDGASDLLSSGRKHCQNDKKSPEESKGDATDCVDSPRECEKCGLGADKWGFGWNWHVIQRDFKTSDALYKAIGERRRQIEELKAVWRFYIEAIKSFDPLHASLEEFCARINSRGAYYFPKESISSISDGISGSYLLKDEEGCPRFVLKPIDEDIGCLNNRKGFSSPYKENTIRKNIPLYLSAMRETLAYEVSKLIGAEGIVPRTTLAMVESDAFHDQFDSIDDSERANYERKVGGPVREKLCSAQEFVPDSKPLFQGLHELQAAGLTDDEIAARFDQKDFEEANLLLWCIYDTDGHMGNFLVYPKGTDAIGNEILGLKKIDNGLAFPERNQQLRNNLRYLPNAKQSLSQETLAKINALSIAPLADQLKQFGLDGSIDALKTRIDALKQIVQENPELSIKEIDHKMQRIAQ